MHAALLLPAGACNRR